MTWTVGQASQTPNQMIESLQSMTGVQNALLTTVTITTTNKKHSATTLTMVYTWCQTMPCNMQYHTAHQTQQCASSLCPPTIFPSAPNNWSSDCHTQQFSSTDHTKTYLLMSFLLFVTSTMPWFSSFLQAMTVTTTQPAWPCLSIASNLDSLQLPYAFLNPRMHHTNQLYMIWQTVISTSPVFVHNHIPP